MKARTAGAVLVAPGGKCRNLFVHGEFANRIKSLSKLPVIPIAANVGKKAGDLFGDGMVPVNSALGRHEDHGLTLSFAPSRQWVGYGMNHWDLLSQPAVYEQIRRWIASPRKPSRRARRCR